MHKTDAPTALTVREVDLCFGGIRALTHLSLTFDDNKVSALIGPNGAGKSTLVNVLTGFQRADAGQIQLGGQVLTGASPQRINRAGVVRTFQSPRVLPGLSVLENVMLSDAATTSTKARDALVPGRKRRAEVELLGHAWDVLDRFDLAGVAHHGGREISGGQQRLVELARMSLIAPRYLILDEPTAGVAPSMRQTMVDHLRRLRHETGAALVIVEHDMAVVHALADEVFVLAEGELLSQGSMDDVRADPKVIDAYLGAELPRRHARHVQMSQVGDDRNEL